MDSCFGARLPGLQFAGKILLVGESKFLELLGLFLSRIVGVALPALLLASSIGGEQRLS